MKPFSVCVFAGARGKYYELGFQAGHVLSAAGVRVIYGGSRFGVMGAVADGVLSTADTSGEQPIVGYMPHYLRDNYAHRSILVYETESLHDRKRRMFDASDAFLCLPGGIGTLDELFSAWGEAKLGENAKPIAILNVYGFWDPLILQLRRLVDDGFLSKDRMNFVRELTSIEDLGIWLQDIRGQASVPVMDGSG